MNLEKMYAEEDLFPREIALWEQRDYGILFYNEENRDSFDSNHAVLFRKKETDFGQALKEIIGFYTGKGIRPVLYQSICDEGYFEERKSVLARAGFTCWTESQTYMIRSGKSVLQPNPEIAVRAVSEWKDAYGTEIFEKAGEPWEAGVAKRALRNRNTLFYVAFYKDIPVGMTHAHITNGVCRVDYLLVSKEYRNRGVGRALIRRFVEDGPANQAGICYLWPDGETAEKIYNEAGFRAVETKQAGRAAYIAGQFSTNNQPGG